MGSAFDPARVAADEPIVYSGVHDGLEQLSVEEGGYHWNGELRLWDNEILMGWYASNDGSIRSKGTMYFVVHPHGLNMSGRWVGLGYDDQIMTGFASMAHSREESEEAMTRLIHIDGEVAHATG